MHTIDKTKVMAMKRLAMAVTPVPALTAKAIDAELMEAKFTVSRKIKNFCTSSSKPISHINSMMISFQMQRLITLTNHEV